MAYKVYVAGKSEDTPRVREVQQLLREHGHTIIHDWTVGADKGDTFHGDMESIARLDLDSIRESDALVAVLEKDFIYRGTFVEIGAALAWGIPVYVTAISPHIAPVPFLALVKPLEELLQKGEPYTPDYNEDGSGQFNFWVDNATTRSWAPWMAGGDA